MKTTYPSYEIPEPVHGEIGGVPYAYDAGEAKPADVRERIVLDHLVAAGVAKRAGKKG